MEHHQLCDSEYRFMEVVWDNAPLPSGRLVELCAQKLGWKKSTTYTVLKKLCGKGLVSNENATVSVLVPRQEVTAAESAAFVDRTFGGSLPGFVAAFFVGRKLSAKEAEELKSLIDAHKEG